MYYLRLATLLSTASCILSGYGQGVVQGNGECADARGFNLCQNLISSLDQESFQMSTAHRASATSLTWSTEYNWTGSDSATPKSVVAVEAKEAYGIRLDTLPVLTTAWTWKYDTRSTSSRAAVKLEVLIGSTKTKSSTAKAFNIQIWLSGDAGRVQPPGTKTAEAYCVSGHDWSIWRSANGGVQTMSFIHIAGEEINFFDGDLGEFVEFLVDFLKVPKTYYIQSIKAVTEVYGGAAKFYTSMYTLWMEYPGEDEVLLVDTTMM